MRTLLITLTLSLAVIAAGCGSGSSPSVADVPSGNGGTATTTTTSDGSAAGGVGTQSLGGRGGGGGLSMQLKSQNAVALASCMRKNGVPNFPDPGAGGSIQIGSANGIDPNSPRFKAAMEKCQKLLPNGGPPSPAAMQKAQRAALAFSRCMRSHGVTNFPDPQFSAGKITVGIRAGRNGIDPNSPTFRRAQQACQALFGGPKGAPGPSTSNSK